MEQLDFRCTSNVSQTPNTNTRTRVMMTFAMSMVALASFFDRLIKPKSRSAEQCAADAFMALAVKLADGHEPKEKDAIAIIEAAGKTADDLQEVVSRILKRRE